MTEPSTRCFEWTCPKCGAGILSYFDIPKERLECWSCHYKPATDPGRWNQNVTNALAGGILSGL